MFPQMFYQMLTMTTSLHSLVLLHLNQYQQTLPDHKISKNGLDRSEYWESHGIDLNAMNETGDVVLVNVG